MPLLGVIFNLNANLTVKLTMQFTEMNTKQKNYDEFYKIMEKGI